MQYFTRMNNLKFYKDPQPFTKLTEKDTLKYAIGANMYMPANKKNIFKKLINNEFNDVGAITLCMEDAIEESMVTEAQECTLDLLEHLHDVIVNNPNLNIPLIFIRVRSVRQFEEFSSMLRKNHISVLAGFNFPKFNSQNGVAYFEILKSLALKHNEVLYGMPILEDDDVIFKETRLYELDKIQKILSEYQEYVLNIRVGGTDFSSRYGLRRDVKNTIYDLKVIADCLMDILNFFLRKTCDYVISGPVWEYFSWDENSPEVIGLKKELELDIQNGFQGKTIIHPSQINIVNEKYIVKYEEYIDAINILNANGGVFKGASGNRMNEVSPHLSWAKKIVARANVFGVYDKDAGK